MIVVVCSRLQLLGHDSPRRYCGQDTLPSALFDSDEVAALNHSFGSGAGDEGAEETAHVTGVNLWGSARCEGHGVMDMV